MRDDKCTEKSSKKSTKNNKDAKIAPEDEELREVQIKKLKERCEDANFILSLPDTLMKDKDKAIKNRATKHFAHSIDNLMTIYSDDDYVYIGSKIIEIYFSMSPVYHFDIRFLILKLLSSRYIKNINTFLESIFQYLENKNKKIALVALELLMTTFKNHENYLDDAQVYRLYNFLRNETLYLAYASFQNGKYKLCSDIYKILYTFTTITETAFSCSPYLFISFYNLAIDIITSSSQGSIKITRNFDYYAASMIYNVLDYTFEDKCTCKILKNYVQGFQNRSFSIDYFFQRSINKGMEDVNKSKLKELAIFSTSAALHIPADMNYLYIKNMHEYIFMVIVPILRRESFDDTLFNDVQKSYIEINYGGTPNRMRNSAITLFDNLIYMCITEHEETIRSVFYGLYSILDLYKNKKNKRNSHQKSVALTLLSRMQYYIHKYTDISVVDLLVLHVIDDIDSNYKYLSIAAMNFLGNNCSNDINNEITVKETFNKCLANMNDKNLVVRYSAALSLNFFIGDERVKPIIQAEFMNIVTRILRVIVRVYDTNMYNIFTRVWCAHTTPEVLKNELLPYYSNTFLKDLFVPKSGDESTQHKAMCLYTQVLIQMLSLIKETSETSPEIMDNGIKGMVLAISSPVRSVNMAGIELAIKLLQIFSIDIAVLDGVFGKAVDGDIDFTTNNESKIVMQFLETYMELYAEKIQIDKLENLINCIRKVMPAENDRKSTNKLIFVTKLVNIVGKIQYIWHTTHLQDLLQVGKLLKDVYGSKLQSGCCLNIIYNCYIIDSVGTHAFVTKHMLFENILNRLCTNMKGSCMSYDKTLAILFYCAICRSGILIGDKYEAKLNDLFIFAFVMSDLDNSIKYLTDYTAIDDTITLFSKALSSDVDINSTIRSIYNSPIYLKISASNRKFIHEKIGNQHQ